MFPSTVPVFLRILPDTVKAYRHRTLLIVFNIARCCVFRSLWLHRNKRLYNLGYTMNGVFARHHFFACVTLHLRKLKALSVHRNRRGRLLFFSRYTPGILLHISALILSSSRDIYFYFVSTSLTSVSFFFRSIDFYFTVL